MPIPDVPPWIGDLDHLNGLGEAALATEASGQIIFANLTARRLYRFLGEDLSRVTLASSLLPATEHDAFGEILRQVLGGTRWAGRLDVRRVDGSLRPADVSCSPLRRDGSIVGVVCVVDDTASTNSPGREARRLEDRLTRLARVAADLGRAEDVQTVTDIVISQAADAVGATVASLSMVLDDDTMGLVGLRGGKDGAPDRWSTFSRHLPTPAGDVVRSGELLVLTGREAIHAKYPDLEKATEGERSMVALPLNMVGRTLGVVTLSFPGKRELDTAELEFFGILADSCAQALERIRARDEAQEQAARVRFLAEAATELSRNLDYEKTMAKVARLAVPTFADWCAIDIVEDGRLHRLAVEHVDPAKVKFAIEIAERYPSDPEAPGGVGEVIRTGRSNLVARGDRRDARRRRQGRGASPAGSGAPAAQRRAGPARRPRPGARRHHLGRRGVRPQVHRVRRRVRRGPGQALRDRHRQRRAAQPDDGGRHAAPARSAARPQRGCPRLGAGQLLQPGRPHRGGRRLLRRPRPGRRPAGPVRR